MSTTPRSVARRCIHPALALFAITAMPVTAQVAGRSPGAGLVIGMEYVVLDNQRLVSSLAASFAETGMTGMKHYVEAVAWGAMQPGPNRPINFTRLDWFVAEFQKQGFTELTVSLRSASSWGSQHAPRFGARNLAPKPQYRDHYARWVKAVVERYDGDGIDDMPGLRWPVRYLEIGNEFSSYEPEPVADYLDMLRLAYTAAHEASPQVMVGHAAFLTTPVDLDVGDSTKYEAAWESTRRVDTHHGLEDLRAVLDHPELFDFINLHNLGDPYEIEHQMRWIRFETGRRGYRKPVVISDTLPTSYAGWGGATSCRGPGLAILVPPATEQDRCRLAAYFTLMVNGDRPTVAWTREFVAADHVQRAVIAAEQGVQLINLSFTADLTLATLKGFRAGSGISAWGGAVRVNLRTGAIEERYPLFHAIAQLTRHLAGYARVTRLPMSDPRARVYRVDRPAGPVWIAWRDPRGVLLPGDGEPGLDVDLPVGGVAVTLEPLMVAPEDAAAPGSTRPAPGGTVRLRLTHAPVYILPR